MIKNLIFFCLAALTCVPGQAQTVTTTTTAVSTANEVFNIAKEGVDPSLRDRIVSVCGVGTPTAIQTWWVIFYDPSVSSPTGIPTNLRVDFTQQPTPNSSANVPETSPAEVSPPAQSPATPPFQSNPPAQPPATPPFQPNPPAQPPATPPFQPNPPAQPPATPPGSG
jgi:hypothetical protein